jgi:hypothetical protein
MAAALPNPWVADPGTDPVARARSLQRLHDAFQQGRDVDRRVRAIVAQSWARSGAAGVDPARHLAPIVLDEREIEHRWRSHPLYTVLPALRELLSDATTQTGHMLVISDAQGVLLWIEGHHQVVEATEEMHFVCGADWSEAGAGTNALGTAIAIDHPVQIFSAEHFNAVVHPWQCSGAPIHDPETGEVLGVIDLTGHLTTAHPHTLALVTAAAAMAEAFLREQGRLRDERLRDAYLARIAGKSQPTALLGRGGRLVMAVPHDWDRAEIEAVEPLAGDGEIVWGRPRRSLPAVDAPKAPAPAVGVRLELLGRRPAVHLDGRRMDLTLRHAELLAVLLLSPRGLTAEQLTLELYGERGKPVTLRAELSRLRRLLGDVVQARPYRLAAEVGADFLDVRRCLDGDPLSALDRYPEPLLVESEVPLIEEARFAVDSAIRHAVMRSGDANALARWCSAVSGADDQPAAELLVSLLGPDDARRPGALARVTRLRATA